MDLKELIGEHSLSAVDMATEERTDYWGDKEQINIMRFVLDDVTYKAYEGPSDGWRSTLRELVVTDEKITNNFEPQIVCGKMRADDGEWHTKNNVLDLYDSITNEVVLSVGTANTDDWYPMCIMSWHPQNLASNKTATSKL